MSGARFSIGDRVVVTGDVADLGHGFGAETEGEVVALSNGRGVTLEAEEALEVVANGYSAWVHPRDMEPTRGAHEPCAVLDCSACGGPRLYRNGDAFETPREPYRDLYSVGTADVLRALTDAIKASFAKGQR